MKEKNYTIYELLICSFLIIAILIIYSQVKNFEFSLFDDPAYVTNNINVKTGITVKNIFRAFHFSQKGDTYYYHPLTMISHMMDSHFFGLSPGAHHLMNVFFHTLNTILLFYIFRIMTGEPLQSALVASLFALHPFNVDSVCWIAERKNLLSTSFWFLGLLAYISYVKQKKILRYIVVMICMLLGLLTKPILVTFPCVLLLLDWWPLNRFHFRSSNLNPSTSIRIYGFFTDNLQILYEKIPLFLLSAIWVYISALSNQRIGQFITTEMSPMNLRIANAIVSYSRYITKTFWPFNFSNHYPYPTQMLPAWEIIGAILLISFVSIFVYWRRHKMPYLIVGWLWYLGTLFPAIGIVQNGLWPAMADRWAYVPLIGIYVMISWSIPHLFFIKKNFSPLLSILTTVFLSILVLLSWNQCRYWSDSAVLFEHALTVTQNNTTAHINLGCIYAKRYEQATVGSQSINNLFDKAVSHFNEAIKINPKNAKPYYNLGKLYTQKKNIYTAIGYYRKCLTLSPTNIEAHYAFGNLLASQGNYAEAIHHYKKSIKYSSVFWQAHGNIANVLLKVGKISESILHYKIALKINANDELTHFNIGFLLLQNNKIDEALFHLNESIRIKPEFPEAHNSIGRGLQQKADYENAIHHYKKAIELNPDFTAPYSNIGMLYYKLKNYSLSKKYLKKVLDIDPNLHEIHYNLGMVLYQTNDVLEAARHLYKAHLIMPDNSTYLVKLKNLQTKIDKSNTSHLKINETK